MAQLTIERQCENSGEQSEQRIRPQFAVGERELPADRHEHAREQRRRRREQPAREHDDKRGKHPAAHNREGAHVDQRHRRAMHEPAEHVPERRRRLRSRNVPEHEAEVRLAQDARRGHFVLPERIGERARKMEKRCGRADASGGGNFDSPASESLKPDHVAAMLPPHGFGLEANLDAVAADVDPTGAGVDPLDLRGVDDADAAREAATANRQSLGLPRIAFVQHHVDHTEPPCVRLDGETHTTVSSFFASPAGIAGLLGSYG